MIYPSDLESKIGFDQIRELLKASCKGKTAMLMFDELSPSYDVVSIENELQETDEFKKIIESGLLFPDRDFVDITTLSNKIKLEGNYLEVEELLQCKLFLTTLIACQSFFKKTETDIYTRLQERANAVKIDPLLFKSINRVIDDHGVIRDTASDDLRMIREEYREEQMRLRKEVERLLRVFKKEGYTVDDSEATIRSGRLVLPVLAEYKRKVQGIIHDESGTGQTVFMEPISLLPYNNSVRELEIRERKEIIRILMQLTDYIRPFADQMHEANQLVGWFDFIRSKASFACSVSAVKPTLQKRPIIKWNNARHPLLWLKNKKIKKDVMPLSIQLDEQNRILLLSGPNAGGKSVCMKTLGLLQYMLQCGLLIPVDEGSISGIFDNFFIDIGDSQSLDNDLSTYSSHIKNLTFFLEHVDAKTLLLIDEFGSGTDPMYGSAIAEAALEKLNGRKAMGIITTHYAGLKALASNTEGLINGSMRFDTEQLIPLYVLDIGVPGSSFTLEIAEKSGLSRVLIDQARTKLDQEQVDLSSLLRDIERERTTLQQEILSGREMKLKHEQLSKEFEEKLAEFQDKRKRLLLEAKEEAYRIVQKADGKAEELIRSIGNAKDKHAAQKHRQEIREVGKSLEKELEPEINPADNEPIRYDWKANDIVRIRSNGAIGKIESVKGKLAIVFIGDLKATVHFSELSAASAKELKNKSEERIPRNKPGGVDLIQKHQVFTMQLDLRGKRTEEAITFTDRWINDAFILGIEEARILHGKGDGILRKMLREHLKQFKQIVSMNDEHIDSGGAGITVLHMRY
jgi:DNA mismatch repair protein MutS2